MVGPEEEGERGIILLRLTTPDRTITLTNIDPTRTRTPAHRDTTHTHIPLDPSLWICPAAIIPRDTLMPARGLTPVLTRHSLRLTVNTDPPRDPLDHRRTCRVLEIMTTDADTRNTIQSRRGGTPKRTYLLRTPRHGRTSGTRLLPRRSLESRDHTTATRL